jgi:hypothetical protein
MYTHYMIDHYLFISRKYQFSEVEIHIQRLVPYITSAPVRPKILITTVSYSRHVFRSSFVRGETSRTRP